MKAERVQFWQRLIDTGRSFASRIYVVLDWFVALGGAIKSVLDDRDPLHGVRLFRNSAR